MINHSLWTLYAIFPLNLAYTFSPDISWMVYCDRGYGHPSGRARISHPATYCSSTPRMQNPALARSHAHLHGLVTSIHEIAGLGWHSQECSSVVTLYTPLLFSWKLRSYNPRLWNQATLLPYEPQRSACSLWLRNALLKEILPKNFS